MQLDNILFAFSLTLLAGLATGIGSAIAFFARNTNTKFLSVSLGFSAGVMIYVSFIEIFSKAKIVLVKEYGDQNGYLITTISFFVGMFLIAMIDKFVPENENPHEMMSIEDMGLTPKKESLMRMGIVSAAAIGIHNFPEGLATFTAALADPHLGISTAIAIAIHNIPEGIAVSVPIYYATNSRSKAFKYSFLSGLSEPAGALAGFIVLQFIFTDTIFGVLFAGVAGIMVYISIDELLPAAQKYGEHHLSIYGLICGMIIMAASLILFS